MCKGLFVCHGDKVIAQKAAYSKAEHQVAVKDSKPALYYITSDGKYAVDADHVSAYELMSGVVDLDSVPKIPLTPAIRKKPRAKATAKAK
jgi:hypothetical protein